MDPTQTPQDPQQPVVPQIDQSLIDKRAEEIASQKIEQMKEDLAQRISGKSGYEPPKTWEEYDHKIDNRIEERASAIAEDKVKAALAAKDKELEDKNKQQLAQTEAQQQEEWSRNSQEWSQAVKDGIIPDINPDIKKKLTVDKLTYEQLTPEEKNDPGLKAYNNGIMLHAQLKQKGESTSLYRTYAKFYNKMPAGALAPVLGGSTPTATPSEELDYDKVVANRRKRLNW